MEQADLVERCKLGDMDAFGVLYERYSVKALHTAYLITGRRETAEDVVQETFVQCFLQIKTLRDPQAFGPWFYRTLTRISWRHCSREKKIAGSIEEYSGLPSMNGDVADAGADGDIEESETRQAVYAALCKLSRPLRTTVILHYFNGLTVKEIAEVMGCFQGTVKSRLHNARESLKRELLWEPQGRHDGARLTGREWAYSARPRV